MQEERATEADFIGAEVEVECPELQGGKRLVAKVGPVDAEAVLASFGGVPALPTNDGASPERDLAREMHLMREIAKHGIRWPAFTFGLQPEPGRPWWGKVRPANRVAIVNAIMEASGLSADGGPLGRFPDEPAGVGTGADAGRTGEAAAQPEPGLAEATG